MSRSPHLCAVLIFDPVPAGLSQPHPPSVPPYPFAPSLPPRCPSPLSPSSSLPLSRPPPPSLVLPRPPSPSSAAGPEPGPRRREGGRASGRAGPRPSGRAGVGSCSCLPLAGDPASPAPSLHGAGSSSPWSLGLWDTGRGARRPQRRLGWPGTGALGRPHWTSGRLRGTPRYFPEPPPCPLVEWPVPLSISLCPVPCARLLQGSHKRREV